MAKKKEEMPATPKRLSNFRFPAKNGRKAETIQAESLKAAVEIYNNLN